VFAGGEELLGQQLAEPGGGLDRPGAFITQRRRPRQQPLCLTPIREHLSRPIGCSSLSIATAMCVVLCGSIPMITVMESSSWDV
jgi:hypothetical protein